MAPASHALEALTVAADRRGHEPWLFFPRDGRWRWWSFESARTEVERWAAALERGEAPGDGAAPSPESSPQALCHHLASSVPDGSGQPGVDAFDRLVGARSAGREVVVVTPAGPGSPQEERDLSRLWLEWCCARLVTLVLEPSPEALAGSVLWCRPTVLLVTAARERALAAAVRDRARGRDRRAAALLDRLRVLLVAVTGSDGAGADPAACWGAWGVERRAVSSGDFAPG